MENQNGPKRNVFAVWLVFNVPMCNLVKNQVLNEVQDKESQMSEFMILGFRMLSGIDKNSFEEVLFRKLKGDIYSSKYSIFSLFTYAAVTTIGPK